MFGFWHIMMYVGILWCIVCNKIGRESSKLCKICCILLKLDAGSNSGNLMFFAGTEIWDLYP